MKVALVTTTINVPTVLRLYRAYGPDVAFFVAGDLKTDLGCAELCVSVGNVKYLSPGIQKSFGYKCSELLGWNSLSRRNIATLEALRWGAEIIVMVDDDNICMNEFYFDDHTKPLTAPFNGLRSVGKNGWFDGAAQLISGAPRHRGFPREMSKESVIESVVGARVGVNAGLCLGDPDVDATFRMEIKPECHTARTAADAGFVVDPNTSWTVWNSQNVAFIRELAPAMFMMPRIGRMDDIWASLICQRVMRERNLHVHFGRPYIWQSRNPHNLISDLKAEMRGMENTVGFAEDLDTLPVEGRPVIEQVRAIYKADEKYLPTNSVMAALAFLEDCEKVMS